MSTVLMFQVTPQVSSLLREPIEPDLKFLDVTEDRDLFTRLEPESRQIDLVIVGSPVTDPVSVAQRVQALDRDLSILILSSPQSHPRLKRALEFATFLGTQVNCRSTEDSQNLVKVVNDAIAATRRRRRKRARQDESFTVRYLDWLLDYAPIGVVVLDKDGVVQAWNRQAGQLFGRSEREVLGLSLSELFPQFEQKKLTTFIKLCSSSTERVPPEVFEFVGTDGTRRYLEVTTSNIRNIRGRTDETGTMVLYQDVTERVVAEMEARRLIEKAASAAAWQKLADELARSNKELEEFAYVASHDLQEPLRKIQAFGERLKSRFSDALGNDGLEYVNRMRNAAARMQVLISDLLTLSRVSTRTLPFKPVDLNAIVRDVLSDLETTLEQTGGKVEVGELPEVQADSVQMRQLFQNLIGNALKFYQEGRPPVIQISGEIRDGLDRLKHRAGSAKQTRISVKDNGIGFDENYKGKIFLPFQRLHGRNEYEGTGMGLAICRRIVERHNGSITAESKLGEGAAFIVTLPLEQAEKPAD
ncbi:MAG: sensor histidine kinase [Acidobacteriota bacterium]